MSISEIKKTTTHTSIFLIGLEVGLLCSGKLTFGICMLILGFIIVLAVIDTNLKETKVP